MYKLLTPHQVPPCLQLSLIFLELSLFNFFTFTHWKSYSVTMFCKASRDLYSIYRQLLLPLSPSLYLLQCLHCSSNAWGLVLLCLNSHHWPNPMAPLTMTRPSPRLLWPRTSIIRICWAWKITQVACLRYGCTCLFYYYFGLFLV